MNPLTFRALEEAFAGRAPAPAPKLIPPVLANPPLPEIVITGPINKVMFLEGKRYALEVARAAGSSIRNPAVAAKIVRDLTTYATAQPSSVAAGIKVIIDLLKEGS
ncbi:hypothetical protein SAMN03159489_02211 [Pseudomonas sp. NFPP07]|uniref:hypothetical protein n=1 Tax=Pseudomonas sp. NFPP07 TaxID=1566213 RepID=UPI0008E526F5|nr:hypothetical protein [Pseudomonas sp. NFPP07]SFP92907.1 hypothetical protein SAMN03159489_02211 [Pseudomonas sp. NFPP07]